MPLSLSRHRGCLLGLAAGDALGATVQFYPAGHFTPLTDIVGGGSFDLKPGEWTDDTSMALCLAESLVECGGYNPADQMGRYLRWFRDGHLSCKPYAFDVGQATYQAVTGFERDHDPYQGKNPDDAGNGSLMRLAPIPMAFASRPLEAIQKASDSSRTTHGARSAADACGYYAGLVVGALNGVEKEDILSEFYCPIPRYWQDHPLHPQIAETAAGSFKRRQPPEIQGAGWVVKTLEAALWAFYHSSSFKEGCLLAANLGDDADTTAAIYGQLAGAYYGEEGIPAEWREKLAMREIIEDFANRLFELANKQS